MLSVQTRKRARQMDESRNGQVRESAKTRWRGPYGNRAENLKKAGWGLVPDRF